jgi:hypothetical protein
MASGILFKFILSINFAIRLMKQNIRHPAAPWQAHRLDRSTLPKK